MGCALGTRMTYILLCEAAPVVFRRNLGKGRPSNSDTVPDQTVPGYRGVIVASPQLKLARSAGEAKPRTGGIRTE